MFTQFDLAGLLLFSLAAFCAAAAALFLAARFDRIARPRAPSVLVPMDTKTVFVFDQDSLLDATPAARRLLAVAPEGSNDWSRLVAVLSPKFPELAGRAKSLDDTGFVQAVSQDGGSRLEITREMGTIRVTLSDQEIEASDVLLDGHSVDAMQREISTLRAMTEDGPYLMWRQTEDGAITWANRAYVDHSKRLAPAGSSHVWPPISLFDPMLLNQIAAAGSPRRAALRNGSGTEKSWYECHGQIEGEEILGWAINVDGTVAAEKQLHEFMQTLTKTFAHLTTGIAIFNKARRLALFNPALADLTSLPVDFLAAQPTLLSFLDRLRDKQMIPEPKDYGSWRKEIAALEAATSDGSYQETWALPNGRTYRVSGRPHTDGAIAFLFEDISAEMSLTRRFRTELELGQSVIDQLEDAVAVFSSNGVLTIANAAYAELWGVDPTNSLGDIYVVEATRTWMEKCTPTPVWGDVRDFVIASRGRSEWTANVRMKDGRALECRFAPLPGGASMARFVPESQVATSPLQLRA